MNESHLNDLIAIEKTYWWHVAKRALIIDLLGKYCPPPAKIIEGGIGGAYTLSTLKRLGYSVMGLDISLRSIDHARKLKLEAELHDIQKPWKCDDRTIDCIIMQDVIEHVEEPTTVLKNAVAALKEGGYIILTVPNHPFLMGPWDKMLGHRRRYTKKILVQQAREAGLKAVWLSGWNAAILPAAILVRLFDKVACHSKPEFPKVSPFVNALLLLMTKLERWYMKVGPLPVGLSIVGIFQENQRTSNSDALLKDRHSKPRTINI